jgi:hypothetical protein
MPTIPALGRYRQENLKFEVILGCRLKSGSKRKKETLTALYGSCLISQLFFSPEHKLFNVRHLLISTVLYVVPSMDMKHTKDQFHCCPT